MPEAEPSRAAVVGAWLGLPLLGCLTLGLAPLAPEPHIVGKVRWVLGGAAGMGVMDWFDLVMHGTPWVLLAGALVTLPWRLRRAAAAGS
jgi:hypothetical protein